MNSSSKLNPAAAGNSEGNQADQSTEASASSVSSTRVADAVLELINLMRDAIAQDAEAQVLAGFLLIAKRGDQNPPNILEVAKLLGTSDASASRIVAVLGRGLRGKPGAGLLETREDPTNYSRKLIFVSPKGQRLLGRLGDTMVASLAKWR